MSGDRRKPPDDASGYDVAIPDVLQRLSDQMELFRSELLAMRPAEELGPTLLEFGPRFIVEYAKAERHKPRGIEAKESILRTHLYPRLGNRQLGSLGHEDIAALKSGIRGATKTINNVLTVLSKMLHVAVDWKLIPRMPVDVRLIKSMSRAPGFYEFEEYRRLVDCAFGMSFRKWAMVLLGGDAGLRLSEVIGLRWEDGVDFRRGDHGQLHVVRAISRGIEGTPKYGKERWVPMTRRLEAAMQALYAERDVPRPTGFVIRRDNGERLTDRVVRNWFSQVQRAAGVDDRGDLHSLRHTFCSHLAMRGAALRAIQDLAGHGSIRTTEKYMHLAPSEKGRAIDLLNEQTGGGDNDAQREEMWRRRGSKKPPEQKDRATRVTPTQCKTRNKASRRAGVSDALAAWREALDEE